jgi:hypothetical protein
MAPLRSNAHMLSVDYQNYQIQKIKVINKTGTSSLLNTSPTLHITAVDSAAFLLFRVLGVESNKEIVRIWWAGRCGHRSRPGSGQLWIIIRRHSQANIGRKFGSDVEPKPTRGLSPCQYNNTM